MRIIAFIVHAPHVRDILAHLGEPTTPPRIAHHGHHDAPETSAASGSSPRRHLNHNTLPALRAGQSVLRFFAMRRRVVLGFLPFLAVLVPPAASVFLWILADPR